jgi:hypothetical protein
MCDVPRVLFSPLVVERVAPKRCLRVRHIAEKTQNEGFVFVGYTFWFLETESKHDGG